jgi:glutaredoxin
MIKLLTTHCPRCAVLQKKLNSKNIDYVEITDIEEIQSYGVDTVPILIVDEEIMDFSAAVQWINKQ